MGWSLVKTIDPNGEQFEREIVNYARDTSFTIENRGAAASAVFNIQGEVSHNARLIWSYEALGSLISTSDIPSTATEIVLSAGKVNIRGTKDYYGKKLFVRYMPSNELASGKLFARIKI